MVTGPPAAICLLNKGTTEPLEPNTLPKRVVMNLVPLPLFSLTLLNCNDCTYFSAIRLLAPMTLLGLTALSVETITNFFTLNSQAKSATFLVPSTLVCMACEGFSSIKGTCLYAAA